jgi:hypothetical protein
MTAGLRNRQQGHAVLVSSRADWRGLIALVRQCATDARDDVAHAEAELRLMTLGRRSNRASTVVLDKDAGATIADTARAFLKLLGVFTRPSMPSTTRAAMAPVVDAVAVFLDDQLHELASSDFQRAHEGRPEVWG